MLLVIVYIVQFLLNGLLAWQFVQPATRQDLGLFVIAWLVLTAVGRTSEQQLGVMNKLIISYEGDKGKRTWEKGEKTGADYGVLLSCTGIGLWYLLNPGSVIQAASFIILWFLAQWLLLLLFTKIESTNTR